MSDRTRKLDGQRKIAKSSLVEAGKSVNLNTNKTSCYFYGAIDENDRFDCF